VYVLTGNRSTVAFIVFLAIVGSVCALIVTSQIFVVPSFSRFGDFKNYVIGWLTSAVVADVIITTILVSYLRKHKTGFTQSDMVIDRVIRVTMSTGLLASMVAVVDLTVYLINPSGIDLMLNLLLCKLYSNSLMSSLNSRRGWRHNEATASVVNGARTYSENIVFSPFREDRRSASLDSKTDVSQGAPSAKASTPFDPKRRLDTPACKGRPEVFVHIESHEVRDASARASASTAHRPSLDEHGDDNHLRSDAMAAFTFSDVPKSVEQSLSSQV